MQKDIGKSLTAQATTIASTPKQANAADTQKTLNHTVDPAKLTPLPNRSTEDVVKLQKEIEEIIPAGNVVGLVLNSLSQLKGRLIPPDRANRDIEALMRSLEMLQKLVYNAAVFVSPAAVLFGYQKMLALLGKDIQSAFPEGVWQFYLGFAMREDTAHHTIETVGFHRNLEKHRLHLPVYDQLAAWVLTVSGLFFQYDDLLLTSWSEQVYLTLLEQVAATTGQLDDSFFQNLKKKWAAQRPYRREGDIRPDETYAQYRQRYFQRFCQPRVQSLPADAQQRLGHDYQQLMQTDVPAFQKQLSILATLNPEQYREVRQPIPIWQARVAIIWQGQYHLLPVCAVNEQGEPLCFAITGHQAPITPIPLSINKAGELIHPEHGILWAKSNGILMTAIQDKPIGQLQPLPLQQVRQWIWAILNEQYLPNVRANEFDLTLLQTRRTQQAKVRQQLPAEHQVDLALLRCSPIILNWDRRNEGQPLALTRLGRRGVGDQAMTIFRTDKSIIFDLSHLFFDGRWGITLAEVMTNEALAWAAYLTTLAPLPVKISIPSPVDSSACMVIPESSAEAQITFLNSLQSLRQNLRQRARDKFIFTINDLLILYRTLFNQEYIPSPNIDRLLENFVAQYPTHIEAIQVGFDQLRSTNPALLIPMDSGNGPPRDRIYPISFRNPFPEFLDLFYQTYNALHDYQDHPSPTTWKDFGQLRHQLVDEIFYFGQLMQVHRQLTSTGESTNMATLKLLGHLPEAVQSMLDKIPQKFDFLNEMLKGDEVFSNLGQVAARTSPTRFMSASDDNNAKSLVWGVMTDSTDIMHISMRDFRPEIIALYEVSQAGLAYALSQDFLDGFVEGLRRFSRDLNEIAVAVPLEIQ